MPEATHRPSVAQILSACGSGAFLITNLANIRYLTGLNVSEGLLLAIGRSLTLYLDGRYLGSARQAVRPGVNVHPLEHFRREFASLRSCAFEGWTVTVERLRAWRKRYPHMHWKRTADVVERFRRAKYPDELRAIQKSCAITRAILRLIPGRLRSGMTERDLAWRINVEAHEFGVEEMAFETIVAFGEHTSNPHHHPTARKLRKGDLIQIDMGVKWQGHCSDYSRVFFTADLLPEQDRAYRTLQRVKRLCEQAVRPGVDVRSLDRLARSELKKHGYGEEFCHSLGHGVGLDIHEGVTLSMKAKKTLLKRNEVITIEPGLYFPGTWGMRVEDTVVVR